jgi:cytochrome c-type biogenesis protein CcmE
MSEPRPARRGIPVGGIIFGVVVVGVALVVLATTSGGQYAVAIDQIAAAPDRFTGEKLRVTGNIKAGSARFLTANGLPETRFAIVDAHGNTLEVLYQQAPPDPFKEGRSAVVEGVLQEDGSILCHKLTVKCPSKYQGEGGDAAEDPWTSPAYDRYRKGGEAKPASGPDGT